MIKKPEDKNENLPQPWDKTRPLKNYDFSSISYPGIYKIVLNLPNKKKVFFGEAENDIWIELSEFLATIDTNDLYPTLRDDMKLHSFDSFDIGILESNWYLCHPDVRQDLLERYQTKFFEKFGKEGFSLYEKTGDTSVIQSREFLSTETELNSPQD